MVNLIKYNNVQIPYTLYTHVHRISNSAKILDKNFINRCRLSNVNYPIGPPDYQNTKNEKLPKTRAARRSPMQTAFKTYFLPLQTFADPFIRWLVKRPKARTLGFHRSRDESRASHWCVVARFRDFGRASCPWFGYVAACMYARRGDS